MGEYPSGTFRFKKIDGSFWNGETFRFADYRCSVEKKWNNFSVFFKGSNLLNSVKKVYIKTHNDANDGFEGQNMDGKTLIKRDTSGIELMLGVHYNL